LTELHGCALELAERARDVCAHALHLHRLIRSRFVFRLDQALDASARVVTGDSCGHARELE
jgi:hypothetical protein